MNYFGPDFDDSLIALSAKGQMFRTPLNKTQKIFREAKNGKPINEILASLKKREDSRIKKGIKVELTRSCRLVLQTQGDRVIFLYVGTHEDVDNWLNNNRGLQFSFDKINNRSTLSIEPSSDPSDLPESDRRFANKNQYLIDSINPSDQETLSFDKLNFDQMSQLSRFNSDTSDEEISKCVSKLPLEEKYKNAISSVLFLAKDKRNKKAIEDICAQLRGEIVPIDEVEDEQLITSHSDGNDEICYVSPDDIDIFSMIEKKSYKKWMLYMHPDQKKIAEGDFNGSIKLKGVSGSGKTSIVINRAKYLSTLYPDEKILILTLNKPLATSIREIVDAFGKKNIEVKSLWSCFEELIKKHIPKEEPNRDNLLRSYGEFTEPGGFLRGRENIEELFVSESIEEVWQQFYHEEDNFHHAWTTMQSTHQYLLTMNVFPEQYIKEEFDYIRSHFSKDKRDEYLKMDREGRAIQMLPQFRSEILEGLNAWYKKMNAVGNIDYLGLTSDLYRYYNDIKPEYRSILVDEEQDLGTLELAIIRKLVKRNNNDLFLAGDVTQRVYTKRYDIEKADIEFDEFEITKNYRNSKEILEAAYWVVNAKLSDPNLTYERRDEIVILEPEYAKAYGYKPQLYKAKSFDDECTYALKYIRESLKEEKGKYGCLIVAGAPHINQLTMLHKALKKFIKDIKILNGDATFDENSHIYLSDLEQSKGFEFDVVVIVDCSKGRFPNPYQPEEEEYRDLSRLYVAMTRAKTDLVISYTDEVSDFLNFETSDEYFEKNDWNQAGINIDEFSTIMIRSPNNHAFTERHQSVDLEKKNSDQNLGTLSGKDLLRTRAAIGMSRDRQDKILKYITGKRNKADNPLHNTWRNLGELFNEDDVTLNRILMGTSRTLEEVIKEKDFFIDRFKLQQKKGKKVEKSTITNNDDSHVTVFSTKDQTVVDKYKIDSSVTREWRAWENGKCSQCGRPAMSGDYVCYKCNPG